MSHPRPLLTRRTSRTARPDCFHLAGTESQGQTKEGQAISGNADVGSAPLIRDGSEKGQEEADQAEAKAGQRVGRRPMSTGGGAGRPPRRGDEAKPQASSCYQRCGLGGVSTANGLQDRVARGGLPACRPLLTPRPKNAPTRRVATSKRRWTSLNASMYAKNRSAVLSRQRFECRP